MNYTQEQLRKIDALVAEHIFNRQIKPLLTVEQFNMIMNEARRENLDLAARREECLALMEVSPIPEYSTDIAAAWEVVEKLKQVPKKDAYGQPILYNWIAVEQHIKGWIAGLKYFENFEGDYFMTDNYVVADTAPLAICLAALKAKGTDVEKELRK